MGIYEELVARGLIAQVTDEAEIRDMINNGVMTVNEVRRKLDFEPVEGGEEHYIQLNMTTLAGVQNNNDGNDGAE